MKRAIVIACAAVAVAALAALVGCSAGSSASTSSGASESGSASVSSGTEAKATTTDAYTVVDADYVASLDADAYLVDVRTAEEYDEGHIPGALNASYPKSSGGPCQAQSGDLAATFRQNWEKLDIPTSAHVVLYCRTGVRAASAAEALAEDGYADIDVYEGSWTDWTSDSTRPIETTSK